MRPLGLGAPDAELSVLAIGAHSDDIEIGAGGTFLEWIASGRRLAIHWCILSTPGARRAEAEAAAADFVAGAASATILCADFRDGHFPYDGAAIKAWFEALKTTVSPDLIFTHRRDDAHQDHREVSRLTWNTFRDHCILEYEIPKWDGDLGQPNVYVPVRESLIERKCELLERHFGTQRGKDWFDRDTFRGLARLRGMECRAADRFAEAFVGHKLTLG